MTVENLQTLKIHELSFEQFKRLVEAGEYDETAIYLTPDEGIDLPSCSSSDNGKFLRVVDGKPAWETIPNVAEVGM